MLHPAPLPITSTIDNKAITERARMIPTLRVANRAGCMGGWKSIPLELEGGDRSPAIMMQSEWPTKHTKGTNRPFTPMPWFSVIRVFRGQSV